MGVVIGYPQQSLFTLRYAKSNLIDTMTILTYNISITFVYYIWCSIRYMLNCIKYTVYLLYTYNGNSPQGPVTVSLTSLNHVIKSTIIMYSETEIKAIVFGDMM